ncbi:MAG: alpha-mannosidase, partial [Anaerolineaceae bacterium]|nr:alpha-mannosidase [Anaerolineaceae bacterium]
MQKHTKLTKRRLMAYQDAGYLSQKFYADYAPVQLWTYAAPGRITYEEAMQGDYQPAEVGMKMGPLWSTHWVKVQFTIPEAWDGKEVHFLWDSASEAQVWQNGVPLQGLTGKRPNPDSPPIRKEYSLGRTVKGGEQVEFYVEVACNGLFGIRSGSLDMQRGIGLLYEARLGLFDREAWDLYWDYVIIADLANYLPEQTPRQGQAMRVANAMLNVIDPDERETWAPARALAAEFFAEGNGASAHNLSAVGHAHIDTAWLWPLAETVRKCYRTFSTAVKYMDEYPEYKFAVSQAVQYEWMKDRYPELYARMKEKAQAGQFIPAGGTYVEMDTNVPSGESLIRQFLFGQRFFEQEFGERCTEFWEPDVFGYSAALPQIMQGVGISRFLTQKLSWNQFNQMPSHSFIWEGLDGSQVLAHFPPVDTYNSMANVKEVLFNVSNYKDHETSKESYLLFGFGDGGGGPTREMLEQLKRMGDVDGLPKVEQRTPQQFFDRLEEDIKDPIKWVGELYFELHRATYTTQAHTKKNNRLSEFMIHDLEFLYAVEQALGMKDYPTDSITEMWKKVLVNQFHDIIPGSSITEVYQDADEDYHQVLEQGKSLRKDALTALSDGEGDQAFTVNTASFPRTEVVEMPEGLDGSQTAANGKALRVVSVPGLGYSVCSECAADDAVVSLTETADGVVMENALLRAELSRGGQLLSLFDKTVGRDAVACGAKANQFVMFDDRPNGNDAWDVDIFHLETRKETAPAHTMTVTEAGPLRATVVFEYKISPRSSMRQTVTLSAVARRLDFQCEVDWNETYKFLKVEFPLNVRSSEATYDVQFGHLKRPTHFNTSWDMARFEVCAHHWADLSEYGWGVALFNDCKYGYSTIENVMRISLLRGPKSPDPVADRGHHSFGFALMPHGGSLQEADVIGEGYRFNMPLLTVRGKAKATTMSFFKSSNPAVVIDTIKKAEDSDDLVVRLYESYGSHTSTRLTSMLPVVSAVETNMLEEESGTLDWSEQDGLMLDFGPFEIKTVRLAVSRGE